jgi:hypothetical protein
MLWKKEMCQMKMWHLSIRCQGFLKMRKIVFIFFPEILTWIYIITQNVAGELKIHKSVDEGSNYYLDKFLAPKNLGLKVGCFTKNIYFKPRSPTSSFATGSSCSKSPAKITCKFPNKTDELLTF